MLKFNTIRWKNLLSTGNSFTEVSLDRSSNTLIIGGNGSGKSTLLDALCFVLFGKGFRNINKPTLINAINQKDCVVEVEFETGNKQYKIVRGIKPNIFEVYVNGSLINQDASIKDYQESLENNILKLNYKSFTQIVILGSASFTPFMQLSAADRRDIIENLLDIKVFSTMNGVLKTRVSTNKQSIDVNKQQTDISNSAFTMIKSHIKAMRQDTDDIVKAKEDAIIDTENVIANTTNTILNVTQEISNLQNSALNKTEIDSTLKKLGQLEYQIETNQKKNKKDIEFFYNNDDCPTCRQSISPSFRNEQLIQLSMKKTEYADALVKIENKITTQQTRLNDIHNILKEVQNKQLSVASLNTSIASSNKYIATLRTEIEKLKKRNIGIDTKEIELSEERQKLLNLIEERKSLLEEKRLLETAGVLLKDTGIKTKIIKQYLPIINKQVNKYLSAMDFFVNFNLDESFKETIKSRHRDEFTYESFSEGEKQRIDIALLLTWRAIAKMKNSTNTNLLILDEVFDSSLDNNGTEYLMNLLQILDGTNLFVISHKGDILQDKFRSILRFEKINNFSRIAK